MGTALPPQPFVPWRGRKQGLCEPPCPSPSPGSQDSEGMEEQKREKILELKKKEKLLQEKLLKKVEELKKICLREAVSGLGLSENLCWVAIACVHYELLTLSCFTGAHRQNAKGISTEHRREGPSGQEASGHHVQARWQLTAYWGGRSMALSLPVPRQENGLFSALHLHLQLRVNAADFSPNHGNWVDQSALFLSCTLWAKQLLLLTISFPVSKRALSEQTLCISYK